MNLSSLILLVTYKYKVLLGKEHTKKLHKKNLESMEKELTITKNNVGHLAGSKKNDLASWNE